mgnify:CR=1 FL=1
MKRCRLFARTLDARSRRQQQSGQAMIEMIFSIVMFGFMMAGIASMSTYLYLQHAMVTAAREGARMAAINPDLGDPGTESIGISDVQDHVQAMVASTVGIPLEAGDIAVTAPSAADAIGERSVSVNIDYEIPNPLPVGSDTFNLHSEATFHYEE